MSFSDLTRSYTTFPTPYTTSVSPSTSRSSSSSMSAASYAYTPRVTMTTYSYASKGASNVPGSRIAAGETALPHAASSGTGAVNDSLALGLGLGLGLGALLTVLAVLYIFRQRKAQRTDFEHRAEVIRAKMDAAGVKPGEMRERA
ncbi:hypothetical protein JCM3770_006758 [Rhodotorula araucariae]